MEDDLTVPGHPEIFATGDVAAAIADGEGPLPQVAQPAIQGGRHVARQIERRLAGQPTEPFRYHDKGSMATIGRHDAVVDFPNGRHLSGFIGWVAWLGLHLVYLMGFRNRANVFINWAWNYITYDRGSRLLAESDRSGGQGGQGGPSTTVAAEPTVVDTQSLPPTAIRIPLLASTMAFAAGLVWSLGALMARLADDTDAWQYLIWRSIGILIVMELLTRARRRPPLLPIAYTSGRLMLLACGALLLASVAFVYAVKNTTAANAAFLASVTPLIAVVLARVFIGERLTRVTIGGIALAFVGLLVMVTADLGAGNMAGNIAALFSSLGFAAYTVCIRSGPRSRLVTGPVGLCVDDDRALRRR